MGGPVDLFVCVFMYICVCVNCILGVCTGACVHVSFFVSFYDCMCVFMLCSILEGRWHSRGNSGAMAVGLATLLE